jgi:ribonuclease P protein component
MAGVPPAQGARVQRRFRLTRSEDFQKVRRTGKSYAHPLLVLVVRANDGKQVRVGVAAGRAVGSAVKRNRAKRLLRAAMQVFVESLPAGWDLVLIARSPLPSSSLPEVRAAMHGLLNRAQLLLAS